MKLLQSQEWRTPSPACWLPAFTKLDINAGYWQVEITEVDTYKILDIIFYYCSCLLFGPQSGPATFQRLECIIFVSS